MSIQNDKTILVKDVMISVDDFPVIGEKVILKEALEEMSRSKLGIACIVDSSSKLLGIITDGDFRRKLLKVQKPFSAFLVDDALDHAIKKPVTIQAESSLEDSIALMGEKQIWDLPVIDKQDVIVGLLHLHPAIKALINLK